MLAGRNAFAGANFVADLRQVLNEPPPPLPQSVPPQLATLIGTSRQTAHRVLHALIDSGVIHLEDRLLSVPDPDHLASIGGELV